MSNSRNYAPSHNDEAEGASENVRPMQRGVSQLLFNYLPYRTVDWEDGLAIVQLGNVKFSTVWEEERKVTLLKEIRESFDRWIVRGGRVDFTFPPDPAREYERFTVGSPVSIDASVLQAALICQGCGQLIFEKKYQRDTRLHCPNCNGSRIHQIPFVFVHGCGELVPIQEWLPASKKSSESGGLPEATKHPVRCAQCKSGENLYIPGRSDRVKDMKVVCRKCNTVALERFTASCHRCLKRFGREGAPANQIGGTIASALAMRLARYSASDTYYPQTISVLRLDKPQLTSVDDEISSTLRRLLPQSRRPDTAGSPSDRLKALSERMKAAESTGDTAEQARLLATILEIAQGKGQGPELAETGLLSAISQDLEKGIKESLAFRGTVSIESAEAKARRESETAELLTQEVSRLRISLGLGELLYVDDLPIITATYGYTRRAFEPIYDELGAHNLPVEIRAFPSVQKAAAQRLGKMDLIGTIPILAREGEHEGIFMSLQPDRVIEWLALNDITLPDLHLPAIARILAALEPIDRDRYYDSIWQLRIRRMVFGLIHSLSHAGMRAMTRYAGIDRTSVAEYIFLPLLGCVVYDSSSSFKLGGVATLVRDHLAAFLRNIADDSVECLYDPDCSDHAGACHGCLHSPEISCRVFNHGLSRAFLLGGHAPWADVSSDLRIVGYWEMQGRQK
jgi:DNA-directed RNA polymerase subunit M/transcription elongation factor TFIIS